MHVGRALAALSETLKPNPAPPSRTKADENKVIKTL